MIQIKENIDETFYTAKNDNVFKSIFCDEHDTFLLKTLIERCLKIKIKLLEIHSPERIKENIYAKGQRLDVLVKADDKLINIEVNSGYYEALHRKSFGYAGSKYGEEVKVGESYFDMNDVIQINFTWGLPKKHPVLGEYPPIDSNTGIKFVDNFNIYEYNMDKIKELWYSGDKEYEFLAIFDFDKEELKKVGSGDKYMTEFKKKVESLNNNARYKEFLSAEEDMRKTNNTFKEIGRREGIEIGKSEGVEERNIEIARNLLKENVDMEIISKATGLTLEEIKKSEK